MSRHIPSPRGVTGVAGAALLIIALVGLTASPSHTQAQPSGSPSATAAAPISCSSSCNIAAGQTASFAGGLFTVTNQGFAFGAGSGPAIVASYDGTDLVVKSVEPAPNTMSDCISINGVPEDFECPQPHGAFVFQIPPANPAGANCQGHDVPAGWSLVSSRVAASVNLNVRPLYTYQAGDTGYEAVNSSLNLPPNSGYWVYFAAPTEVSFGCILPIFLIPPENRTKPQSITVGAGLTLIGAPINFAPVTVTGADAVYTYDPATGYTQTTTLQPWQGAWVYTATGGTVTLTPAPAP